MKSRDVISVLKAVASGDRERTRQEIQRLAATEKAAGRQRIARQIEDVLQHMGPHLHMLEGVSLDPKVANRFLVRNPTLSFEDLELPPQTMIALGDLKLEREHVAELQALGLRPRRRLLFHGPPGCGKTSAAEACAQLLELPLMIISVPGLVSSYMGSTEKALTEVFNEMERVSGVYLLDEMETLTSVRGQGGGAAADRTYDSIVNAITQLLDHQLEDRILIGATNRLDMVDPAIVRRFDHRLPFPLPRPHQLATVHATRLREHGLEDVEIGDFVVDAYRRHLSYADVQRIVDQALRRMILDGSQQLEAEDLQLEGR